MKAGKQEDSDLFIGHTCLPPCSHRVLTRVAPPCQASRLFPAREGKSPAHLLRLEPRQQLPSSSSLRFPEPQGVISLFGLKASTLLRNNAANRERSASLRRVLGSGPAHAVSCSSTGQLSQGRCPVLNPSKSSDLRPWSVIYTNGDSKITYS